MTPFMQSLGVPQGGALAGNVGQASPPPLTRFNYQGPNMRTILEGLQGGNSPYTPITPPTPQTPPAMQQQPRPPAASPFGSISPATLYQLMARNGLFTANRAGLSELAGAGLNPGQIAGIRSDANTWHYGQRATDRGR